MTLTLTPALMLYFQQECIPVECVPSAAVAVPWGRGCLPRGCLHRGVSVWVGVSAQVSARGAGCLLWGVSSQGRGCMPRGDVSQDPLVNRITDRCKTLPCRNYVAGGNYSIHTKWQQNRQNSNWVLDRSKSVNVNM